VWAVIFSNIYFKIVLALLNLGLLNYLFFLWLEALNFGEIFFFFYLIKKKKNWALNFFFFFWPYYYYYYYYFGP
jgi:hypothetical protein